VRDATAIGKSPRCVSGLAASFQVWPLIALADQALDGAPGDPVVLRQLQAFVDEFPLG
jgi:hypothetical protein